MSPRDGDHNEGEIKKLENIERTKAQKASDQLLQLLYQHHPEQAPSLTMPRKSHSSDFAR